MTAFNVFRLPIGCALLSALLIVVSGTAAIATAPEPAHPKVFAPLSMLTTLRGKQICSPKSVIFSQDGTKFYINSLEGCQTAVYDTSTLQLRSVIEHRFTQESGDLFRDGEESIFDYIYHAGSPSRHNIFSGKPVESVLSHGGRYLWVSYYRRDYDVRASSPSAVAIIDTTTDSIVRVIPTGPLPKVLALSPNNKELAVIHWGDNSVGLLDISSSNPQDFTYEGLLVSGKRLDMGTIQGDRDKMCGQCLRGAVFSQSGKYLFVARMGRSGIDVFDVQQGKLLGVACASTIFAPRHLAVSPDTQTLYVTSGDRVYALSVDSLLGSILPQIKDEGPSPLVSVEIKYLSVGKNARTLVVSPDGQRIYVVCNGNSTLYRIDVPGWKVTDRIAVPPFAVGLAISPDERLVITTSQGKAGKGGGNVVAVFDTGLQYALEEKAAAPESQPEPNGEAHE